PRTRWEAVLPPTGRRHAWKTLHEATGLKPWPMMWPWGSIPSGHATVADTANYLAIIAAAALQPAGAGWSRARIESTIRGLMGEQLESRRLAGTSASSKILASTRSGQSAC